MEISRNQETENNNTIKQRIGLIGLGNMGSATLRGLISSGLTDEYDVLVCNRTADDTQQKLQPFTDSSDAFIIAENNFEVVEHADILFVTLKQNMMMQEFTNWRDMNVLSNKTLVVSMAAGVWTDTCKNWLGNERQPIARVMPNTPTASGRGVLGWTISEDATVRQQNSLRTILGSLGFEIQVENDEKVDVITAISGSGPAYIYRFVEAMENYARQSGFTDDVAQVLVGETLVGAAIHYLKSKETVVDLRRKITSKGGTTEAAINSFETDKIDGIVNQAMTAAYTRAREIGKKFDSLE